ncbi:hypothetical protein [Billgrantia montanilacus]|uniref:EthD domain-containing protein n=1 Tax=Billgrantia montanilacus TaxID=2282305 RepID=A0A368TUD4_9GAMM|nr:hypothetical protein [Halomonas montanilacus]RCV88365.1 hypothetical protein DU505_13835 [Halomonas montanilacus]
MPSQILLISRYSVKPGQAETLATTLGESEVSRIFVSLDEAEVVELRALEAKLELSALTATTMPVAQNVAEHLVGDVRRELLDFVEAPKDIATLLPATPYIQLRHVEVKPEAMDGYRQWREETIFDVVRSADEVQVFLAYHSVVSGQPGVMFVSGFSADPESYNAVFASDRYREIVQQAGDRYITGGSDGLYTKIYRALPHLGPNGNWQTSRRFS